MIIVSFCVFDRENYVTLAASLIGVTSLIFNAKGNPFGRLLMILFSVLYGLISLSFAYYGEMITYLGMSMPMSVFALITWRRNPYQGNRTEVEVNTVDPKEIVPMLLITVAVTVLFYFILSWFHTANIVPSTISVTTSFFSWPCISPFAEARVLLWLMPRTMWSSSFFGAWQAWWHQSISRSLFALLRFL